MGAEDVRRLRTAVLELLGARAPESSICPSEAARRVGGDSWRDLMDAARGVAADLADEGRVEVTQGGRVVDVRTARGPVRIRWAR